MVTSSLTPTVFGQGVTFTATVSATPPATGIPSGQVTFYDGSTPIDTETLVDGSATYTTSALAVGGHTITIHYSGDSTFVSGNSTAITQTVDQADTATTVTPSVNPTDYGQPVTFTATVSAASPGSGTPSGQVTFYDGTTAVDTETLKSGTAGYTTSALSLAGHSITAKYLGNTDFAISTSTAITQTVDQDDSKTLLSTTVNPVSLGQSVSFTATVLAATPGSGTPTGSVVFYDGTSAVDTETLVNGTAEFTTSSLALGGHAISAVYGGDTNFAGSPSNSINETVKQANPAAAVSSSVSPSAYGQSVTFTATVTPATTGTPTPTGHVVFYDGTTAIDTETLVDGSASYMTSALALGGHSITIQYGGDANYNGVTSNAITQTVDQASTTTAVVSSENPSNLGDSVTFTATVSATAPGSGTPTGQVTFYDGTTAIDTETLSGGMASYTTTSLAIGGHSITAQYLGSTDFAGSPSIAFTQTVKAQATATLDGEVYNDADGSGTIVAGAGLASWTVNLMSGTTTLATTTTGSDGSFSFTNVVAGSYTIAVAEQSGYVATVPASGERSVTPASGETVTALDFGEFRTVTVGGEVFNDLDGSGTFKAGDPGLSGWTVNLSSGNQIIQTTQTDSSGDYSFGNVGPGSDTIAEVLESGYVQTDPATGVLSLSASSGVNVSGEDIGATLFVPTLTLTLDRSTVSDAAGANAATATVSRNAGLDTDLVVTLASDDTSAATVPMTVTIPAGQASATFAVAAVDDGLVDGNQTPTLTASAAGFVSGTAELTVDETDVPTLQVALDPTTVMEGNSVTGTVQRNWITDAPLAVTFSASTDGRMTLPVVVIPADQSSATFSVLAIHDSAPEKDETFTLTAAAGGFVSGSADLTIDDEIDLPTLTLTTDATQVPKDGAGVTFTVSRAVAVDTPLTVYLTSSDATHAVPASGSVVIPAFETWTTFLVNPLDDHVADGNETVTITAHGAYVPCGCTIESGAGTATLLIIDSDAPALQLSADRTSALEGVSGAFTLTLTRNTSPTDALVVQLSSSDSTELPVPSTMTIPAGQYTTTVVLNTGSNPTSSGAEPVNLAATADGLESAALTLTVISRNAPDLGVSDVTIPDSGLMGDTATVGWTDSNTGRSPPWRRGSSACTSPRIRRWIATRSWRPS